MYGNVYSSCSITALPSEHRPEENRQLVYESTTGKCFGRIDYIHMAIYRALAKAPKSPVITTPPPPPTDEQGNTVQDGDRAQGELGGSLQSGVRSSWCLCDIQAAVVNMI